MPPDFLNGDEKNGHLACIDGHLTTAYNPGMRLMPPPVIIANLSSDLFIISKILCAFNFKISNRNLLE